MTTNVFADLPSNLPDALFTTLLQAGSVHASPEGFWCEQ
jgi:hypothetical protein